MSMKVYWLEEKNAFDRKPFCAIFSTTNVGFSSFEVFHHLDLRRKAGLCWALLLSEGSVIVLIDDDQRSCSLVF